MQAIQHLNMQVTEHVNVKIIWHTSASDVLQVMQLKSSPLFLTYGSILLVHKKGQ